MEDADDEGLLVVNLENCISDTADEQVVNDDGVYAVAVTSNTCSNEGEAVIQMPVSMGCAEVEQQSYVTVPQLVEEQLTSHVEHYNGVQTESYTQIETGEQPPCVNAEDGAESSNQSADVPSGGQVSLTVGLNQGHCDHSDSSYYTQIYNYLTSQAMPAGATESYKKILKKRARNYKIMEDVLYYGQRLPKRVITDKTQQREIMKSVHVEEGTGVHLGLRKMYMAINQFYFWKGLYIDIAHFVRECEQCSETSELQPNGCEKHQQLEEAEVRNNSSEDKNAGIGNGSKVWQKVELKLCGPYPKTVLQNEFIITIADSFSHWIVAYPLSGSNCATHIADFVCKTFCTFGFAKCSVIGVPQDILEMAQSKYKDYVSRLRDTLLTCGLMDPECASTCGTGVHSLHVFHLENVSHCTWVENLLNEFVQTNPQAWDVELERFLFEYCTTAGGATSSPFTIMFGRSPISYLEDDKENKNVGDGEKPTETLSKRRRLQSTILQCRHCEEIFTSKISFRIHQRKHTEEACRQGTLEGQLPIGQVAEREKRLLKRMVLKQRQKLLKHGHLDRRERLMTTANQKLRFIHEYLPKDRQRAELQANTVAAVRKLMATTKEERRRRGKYHKYPAELQEEMALYAMQNDNESKDHLHLSRKCASRTLLVKDSLCPDNKMKNSASHLSDVGVLSLDSESIPNVSTPTAYEHDSSRIGQEETSQSNGTRQGRILESTCSSKQMAAVEGVHTYIQELKHSSDINIVVYTETVLPGALQTDDGRKSAGYMHELHQGDSSGIQQNERQCEGGTTDKPCGGCNIAINERSTDVFHCDICGTIFLNKTKLITHIEQHSSPSLKCTHCSYTTKSSRLLDYHQNVHTGKFKCKVCNKLFTRKIYLTYHLRDIHCKSRHLHSCEECSAQFTSSSGLRMHVQTVHEPLKTYPCAWCEYVGNSTNSLASHMLRNHRKKYKCKLCDYGSLTQGGLDKHLRIYHNPDDRQFACKLCSYRGLKRRQLLDHERIVHRQDKNKHVCPVCKKSFRTQVLMKHHLPAHSAQHLYSCRGCSYTARYRQTFHLHLKHYHPTESFKNLCNGPSEADFEAIISTALKTLEQFPASDEQSLETDYTAQVLEECPVMEDAGELMDVPVFSKHVGSESAPGSSQDTVNSCAEDKQNEVPALSNYEHPQHSETETNPELVEGVLVTEGVVNPASELNQAVTIIDGSTLTSDEVQRIVGLAGNLGGGMQEVCHLVTLSTTESENTLFKINVEDHRIHQVVTMVNDLNSITEANDHAVTLLNSVPQCEGLEHSTVARVSMMDSSDISQGNLVVLPLRDAKVSVVQNESFSDRQSVLDKQIGSLDLVAEQSELIQ